MPEGTAGAQCYSNFTPIDTGFGYLRITRAMPEGAAPSGHTRRNIGAQHARNLHSFSPASSNSQFSCRLCTYYSISLGTYPRPRRSSRAALMPQDRLLQKSSTCPTSAQGRPNPATAEDMRLACKYTQWIPSVSMRAGNRHCMDAHRT